MNRTRSELLTSLLLAVCALGGASLMGCKAHVGSKCTLNTDCSLQGTLVCDTSQPSGYCTNFNCTPNSCQNSASCVELSPSIPGCAYNDYQSPSRTARSMCLQGCQRDSDCRTSDGYECAYPSGSPWDGITIDTSMQKVCLVKLDYDADAGDQLYDAAVCQASFPDGTVQPNDAGTALEPLPSEDDGGDDGGGDAEASDGASRGDAEGGSDAGRGIEAAAGSDAEAGVDAGSGSDAGVVVDAEAGSEAGSGGGADAASDAGMDVSPSD